MAGCQIRPVKKDVTFFETRAAFSSLFYCFSYQPQHHWAKALQARRRTSRPSAISPRPQSSNPGVAAISFRLSRSRPVVANLKLVAPLIAREAGNEKETALVKVVARFINFRFTCVSCVFTYKDIYRYVYKIQISN